MLILLITLYILGLIISGLFVFFIVGIGKDLDRAFGYGGGTAVSEVVTCTIGVVFWPLTAVCMIIALIYDAVVDR
jgi:hypothetical protein